MRIVIFGASSAIAEHCARLWLLRGAQALTLIGRDRERIERVAADLQVRTPGCVPKCLDGDLLSPASLAALVDAAFADGPVDLVLVAHGMLPDQSRCESDPNAAHEAITVNATSPALIAGACVQRLQAQGHGTLALIGSVAGDRGRGSNYVYGAAKAMLDRFAEGLQHRLAGSAVRVVRIKPGPTATPMTAHLGGGAMTLAPVDAVARAIVDGIAAGRPVVYAPARWRWIMLVLRHLPAFVFNRLRI